MKIKTTRAKLLFFYNFLSVFTLLFYFIFWNFYLFFCSFFFFLFHYIFVQLNLSCPAGFKMSGSQCINDNECLWFPCQNGGRCRDHSPPKKYECLCPIGFTGLHCELELLASGVLTPSSDFIIALLSCACSLICKYTTIVMS